MSAPKVIVFGPTGAVGSAAARTAAEKGAKVYLAMRDTSKTIPGLAASTEQQQGFERIEADLTAPESVFEAAQKTGAKTAFLYIVYTQPDVKPTLEALRRGGVERVVFLSSLSIEPHDVLAAIPPSEIIKYAHAQVEIKLAEVFGTDGFVALRPGYFATNTFQYKNDIHAGKVGVFLPRNKSDHIAPEDIGGVAGSLLARGGVPADGSRVVYLVGTRLVSNEETVQIIARALNKPVKVEETDETQAYKNFAENMGVGPAIAEYLVRSSKRGTEPGRENTIMGIPVPEEWYGNIEKYSGKKATTFEEWVDQNKQFLEA